MELINVQFEYGDDNLISHGDINFFRACSALDRANNFGIYDDVKNKINCLDKCAYCNLDITTCDENPYIYYIITPLIEYFLCEECGLNENINYDGNKNLIHKYKLKVIKYISNEIN